MTTGANTMTWASAQRRYSPDPIGALSPLVTVANTRSDRQHRQDERANPVQIAVTAAIGASPFPWSFEQLLGQARH